SSCAPPLSSSRCRFLPLPRTTPFPYTTLFRSPDPDEVQAVLAELNAGGDSSDPMSESALSTATGIRPGRLSALVKILAVDGALRRVEGGWVATGEPWHFDAPKWQELHRVREAEAD